MLLVGEPVRLATFRDPSPLRFIGQDAQRFSRRLSILWAMKLSSASAGLSIGAASRIRDASPNGPHGPNLSHVLGYSQAT